MINNDTKKVKIDGAISIARSTGSDGHSISISVEDRLSGLHVLELRLSMEEFGNVVTGSSGKTLSATVYQNENLGKEQEVATAQIPLEGFDIGYDGKGWEAFNQFVETYVEEKFGSEWKADLDKSKNHYRVINGKTPETKGKQYYSVHIRRWL
jgi:hypothetical protein